MTVFSIFKKLSGINGSYSDSHPLEMKAKICEMKNSLNAIFIADSPLQ